MEVTMTQRVRSLGVLVLGLAVAVPMAPAIGQKLQGQLPCGKRKDLIEVLKKNYGERAVAHGLANSGAVAEVYVGPGGTWTIVATSPNGVSCLIGAGEAWEGNTVNASAYDEGI
jgi:hypothetical protein